MISDRAKRFAVALIFLGIAAVVVAVIRAGSSPDPDADPVATVGGVAITRARFEKSYIDRLMTTGRNDTPVERYAQLDNLVQNRLLADEARRRGLDRGPEYDEYLERNRLMAAGARFFDESIEDRLPPLEEEDVRRAYRNSREKVVLRHLFFKSEEKAKLAVDLLREGEDFVDLANEVFDTPAYDSSAGMLGAASYWALDDAVAEVAFNLAPYEISDPVRSRYGWHVLRMENRFFSPILVESDYQMRREGIEGRERIRRNRIAGDEWVREFMASVDPQVDTEAARMVVDAVEFGLKTDTPVPHVQVTPEEVEQMRAELEPGTVVVRYTLDGEEMTFTAGDFVRWLPELPYDEVRDRPMAAVGRALRNQVLGIKGIREGYLEDPWAQEAVQFAEDTFLADRLRERLREESDYEPTEDEITEAFDRLRLREMKKATADYWSIPFPSFADARKALEAIESGADPGAFDGYERHDDANIRISEMGGHLRRAPMDTPVVICLEDFTCAVVRVENRSIVYTTLEERRDDIREALMRLMPEERMTDSLFRAGGVRVDTTLFRSMMERS